MRDPGTGLALTCRRDAVSADSGRRACIQMRRFVDFTGASSTNPRMSMRAASSAGEVRHAGRMHVDGLTEPGFEPVREALEHVLDHQAGTGAAVAAWHDGRWVVDLWGGAADAARTRAWQPDSIAMPYSVTKPFAAVCALVLVQRGRLDLDAPVQQYWPEFSTPATVRQVLSHQVGVVALDDPAETELLYDWHRLCDVLARQPPAWESGSAIGECALFYGHLVGELVRRVDGRSLGAFLRDEVAGPAGLDFAVGLAAPDLARAVELTCLDEGFRRSCVAGAPDLYAAALLNPPGVLDAGVVNSAAFRQAEIPAVNGHDTAAAVAGFYAALLEDRLLDPGLRAEATTAQASGVDRVMGGEERAWGLGFGVDEDGFGMGGTGGSFGWCSTHGRYAFGFVTGTMGGHERGELLENAFRQCLGLPPI
jgi:CubicO group peptidase (beta-lactamase class C family)